MQTINGHEHDYPFRKYKKTQTNKNNCINLDLTIEASFGNAQDLKWCCISPYKEIAET